MWGTKNSFFYENGSVSHSVMPESLQLHGLQPPGSFVHEISQARILKLPFPSPRDLCNPGIEPGTPAFQADSLLSEPPAKPHWNRMCKKEYRNIQVFISFCCIFCQLKFSRDNYMLSLICRILKIIQMDLQKRNRHKKQTTVQFSCSVVSNSLRPHELHHARPPCPTPTPRVHPNPCPLSRWCHPTISSSVDPFSSCPQSFPASGSFPVSQLFASGGQSIGVSASASTSVLPMNTQDWSPLGWTGWISLCLPKEKWGEGIN